MNIYAVSDPHGCLEQLKRAVEQVDFASGDTLMLLGDYVPHQERFDSETKFIACTEAILSYVRELTLQHKGHAIALMGNHEYDLLESIDNGERQLRVELVFWLRKLPLFHETEKQIFVHAGIDEAAGDLWKWGTSDEMFLAKPYFMSGHFEKDIVSGHISAHMLARGKEDFPGVFWDGASHFVIDGATEVTGTLPVLRYDSISGCYSCTLANADGLEPWRELKTG